jgi:beta-1,4-mannosyl-glycoprotein beta-1,4-N-acetylglucosaminyltransferase
MIYDCFTFFNEFDLLELRLRILDRVVDRFVLCEAPFTFRGAPKPLAFAEQAERFAPWRDRIIALVYPGPPHPDPWRNEFGQRDHLIAGLRDAAPDDLVLIGDVDEIPDPANVGRTAAAGDIVTHLQRLSLGYFNRVVAEPWYGTRTISVGAIARYGSLNAVRGRPPTEFETVSGGWHFSSLGGPAVAEEKMRAYSHAEYDVPYYRDPARLTLTFAHDGDARWMPLDDSFPAVVREDPRWSRFVWPRPDALAPETLAALEHAYGCLGYVPSDAAAVLAVSPQADAWRTAGSARFGARFALAPDAAALAARADKGAWCVLDGLERVPADALRALRARCANVVAYAANARSRDVLDAVALGSGYPAGRALGRDELHAWLAELGWRVGAADRIAIPGVFALFAQMPAQLGVEVGRFRLPDVTRERLVEFLARGFVFTLGRT